MALHLAEISQAVAQGAHAILLMDQAGWHSSARLEVPDNITIVLFPLPLARTQPGRECLAVPTRQLAVEPGLHIL
jgi:hypothetical protein